MKKHINLSVLFLLIGCCSCASTSAVIYDRPEKIISKIKGELENKAIYETVWLEKIGDGIFVDHNRLKQSASPLNSLLIEPDQRNEIDFNRVDNEFILKVTSYYTYHNCGAPLTYSINKVKVIKIEENTNSSEVVVIVKENKWLFYCPRNKNIERNILKHIMELP